MSEPRIYLDNAATSWPKPAAVYEAVDQYQRELGCAVGRGSSRAGLQVQQIVDRCRVQCAALLGAPRPEQVVFTFNGTDSLNLALHGFLKPGDRVITTPWEHNSVLRPLKSLQSQGVTTHFLSATASGAIDLAELEEALRVPTRLVALTHASNVTGVMQPVEAAIRLAHAAEAKVLIDAAQTAGHLPVSFGELNADLLACPGHKGLLGPLGTGLLIMAEEIAHQLQPLRQGGTGTSSEREDQPAELPVRFESGNHNAPGLVGLQTAVNWLLEQGVAAIHQREQDLVWRLETGLRQLPGIHIAGDGPRIGLLSIWLDRMEPQVLSTLLDDHFRIETRAGLHCAPRSHQALQTQAMGGTVRFSVGPFTKDEEIDATLEALAQIVVAQ